MRNAESIAMKAIAQTAANKALETAAKMLRDIGERIRLRPVFVGDDTGDIGRLRSAWRRHANHDRATTRAKTPR